jgi:hypothetical protein
MRAIRLMLQAILFFFLLGIVVAIGSPETGVAEKLVLAVLAGGLIWLAAKVRRIGDPHGPHSA